MKTRLLIPIYAVCLALTLPVFAQSESFLLGDWQGSLSVSGMDLHINFHINRNESGELNATMDSPDQGARGIPVSEVILNGDSLTLKVASVNGSYSGVLDNEKKSITGTWKQSGHEFALILHPLTEADRVKRPQEPKPPFPYTSEDVTYRNEAANITLAGTLTIPESGGPFPAAVLISGSGAQNRDEEIFQHKPFLVLSDFLTRRGIAVLRVDDRGVGGSEGSLSSSTSRDFAGDVYAGVSFLKQYPRIDKTMIGLIGHSEGGIIAPMVAAEHDDIAFIVLMAGTGLPGEEILYMQGARILKANGATDVMIEENRKTQEKIFNAVKKYDDEQTRVKKLREVLTTQVEALPEAERNSLGNVDQYINAQIHQVNNPWFRFFLTYDPRPTLRRVTCPVLAINGGRDLQVPAEANISEISKALEAGGSTQVSTHIFPGLNHLFQTAETGSPLEYGKIEETISPPVLDTIVQWIIDLRKD